MWGALGEDDRRALIPDWRRLTAEPCPPESDAIGGPQHQPQVMNTSEEYLQALEKSAADARAALKGTNEEFLKTKWRLLAAGQIALETPRYEMIRDTINHWAHHRGQMTVYLRLMGAKVPALYGPSADDKRF